MNKVKVGDEIIIQPLQAGGHRREGEVLEVLGESGHERYRVRWDDNGHESIFFPGSDAFSVNVKRLQHKR